MEKTKYLDLLAQYGINSAHPGGLALTKTLLRNEKITSNTALLDVGCGTGQTAAYIAMRHPCKVTAVDIHPQMLQKARRTFTKYQLEIPLIHANAMDLPFPQNSFDIVLAESVTVFTDIRRTLREYYRVLKPGGFLLAIEATALTPLNETEMGELEAVLGIPDIPTKNEWCQMFQITGFPEVQILFQQPMNWTKPLSPELNRVFHEYFNVLFHYREKFGYGVYRCQL